MRNRLFRSSIFGGYKKEDVQAYIARLEAEITRSQGPAATETKTASALEKTAQGIDDVVVLSDILEEFSSDTLAEKIPSSEKMPEGETPKKQPENGALESETRNSHQTPVPSVKELERKLEEAKEQLKEALAQKESLEKETRRLREERRSYEQDYGAVKEVLLNARLDAEIILTKARKEARLLIENTKRQIAEQRKASVTELMRHLSENHSGLQASKYYLEEQVKNIERAEKQIEALKIQMEDFLGTDVRVDGVDPKE